MRALRPYQDRMVSHILDHDRCALFARMGAGKTVSVLTALTLLDLTEVVFPVLVLAPKRVAINTWPDEVKDWPHLRHLKVRAINGSALQRRHAALRGGAHVYCMAYDNIQWLADELNRVGKWFWPTVVCDESTRLKGMRLTQGAMRTKALAPVAHTRVERWINLTGIPAPNGLQDLWGQTWFLDSGKRLGRSYSVYSSMHFIEGRNGTLHPKARADEEIAEKLADICLTIDPRDHLDVKKPNLVLVPFTLPDAVLEAYKKFKRTLLHEIPGGTINATTAAVLSLKLRQFASGFVYDDKKVATEVHDHKLDALGSIIEEQAGAPLLVAYYFAADLVRLKKRFKQGRELDAKPSTIAAWNAGEIPVLFAHPKSAGHGLNLAQGGCDIAFYSHDWNMEEREQIVERIGPTRQAQGGYHRPVTIYNIVASGTIDTSVISRTDDKVLVNDLLLNHLKE